MSTCLIEPLNMCVSWELLNTYLGTSKQVLTESLNTCIRAPLELFLSTRGQVRIYHEAHAHLTKVAP